uniref:Uncharacterized protein n=1 Tax=Romanomermis culicivorax TaxID=13658 RepID=A0A915ILZ4_ROMCU
MDYADALKEEIQHILLPQPTPASAVPQVRQQAAITAHAAIQPPAALLPPPVPQPPPPATLLPLMAPMDTSATPQPKVKTTKTAAPAKHTLPAHRSDKHGSCHKSRSRDDRHLKETQQPHTARPDSRQHEHPNDAPLHHTQSEQTRTVHSTGFYEEAYKHAFRQSPPKLTDYISPLQGDAKIQERLEALKNQLKPVFKVPLTPPPPMDVEPATSSSMSLPPTATLLGPTALTSATATTITHTTSLPPTAPTSVQTTMPAQPSLVITTRPVLNRSNKFAQLHTFPNHRLGALHHAGIAALSASYQSICRVFLAMNHA